jgi:thiol-disulfide isomerase/thioredoxin
MSKKKRAGARPRISHPVNEARPRQGSQSPLLVLGLVALTMAILAAIVIFAVSKSNGTTATPATPVATPGAPTPTPITGPLPGIGILDPNSGASTKALATPAVGSKAPDFSWTTTTGHASLSAMRGHAILLEFFGAWCPACQQEVPLLNKLLATYGPKGLEVLSVTGSPYGIEYETAGNTAPVTMLDLLRYQKTLGVTYQEVLDATTRVFNMYGFGQSFPTFYVIDRKGIVRYGTSIAVAAKDLTAQVKAAL